MRRATESCAAGFGWGAVIGSLGGLIGLGGAEFRLPVLVGRFTLPTLEAVILNKAMSLVVVTFALLFRRGAIPFAELWTQVDIAINLLAGSLFGAWWAAGHAMRLSRRMLDQVILVLLVMLALVILAEAWLGGHDGGARWWPIPPCAGRRVLRRDCSSAWWRRCWGWPAANS